MSRRSLTWLGVVLALLIGFVAAFQLALGQLQRGVERALGPRASVGSLRATWNGLELRDLRIAAERAGRTPWPAADELRAARVHVVPDIASLWSSGWRVRRITVDDGFVSVLRARNGKLRVLPSLLETAPNATPTTAGTATEPARVQIGTLRFNHGTVEFFDASVRTPPHRMRLEQLNAELGPLVLPALDVPVDVELQALFKGPQRDGRLTIGGQVTPSTRDAQLDARFAGVDLLALQPYLLRVSERGVRRGTLDLTLNARVRNNMLRAPGRVSLSALELGDGSFAGLPRQAVVAALSRDGRITVDFTLEGRLDDPNFSLNEDIAVRIAAALAEALGVSLGGVVEGAAGVIKGLFGR